VISGARHYLPLVGFVLPTLIIGYGFVIPRSCIHGVNELSIGFGTTVLGAALTYVAGVRSASRQSCPARMPWRVRFGRYINRQASNPGGPFGRLLAFIWWFEHRRLNAATLELLRISRTDHVAEIGCGPGWALREASRRATEGHVLGIDVSETVLSVARRTNRRAIADGRASLRRTDGTELALDAASIDRAFAVHSIYFWNHPERVIAQVFRALRPGGRLVLAFRPDGPDIPARFRDDVYRFYAPEAVEESLGRAGFRDVRVVRRPEVDPELVWVVTARS
jgi:SAM-dependent methyltransferase